MFSRTKVVARSVGQFSPAVGDAEQRRTKHGGGERAPGDSRSCQKLPERRRSGGGRAQKIGTNEALPSLALCEQVGVAPHRQYTSAFLPISMLTELPYCLLRMTPWPLAEELRGHDVPGPPCPHLSVGLLRGTVASHPLLAVFGVENAPTS